MNRLSRMAYDIPNYGVDYVYTVRYESPPWRICQMSQIMKTVSDLIQYFTNKPD